jgi:hypothetical protein
MKRSSEAQAAVLKTMKTKLKVSSHGPQLKRLGQVRDQLLLALVPLFLAQGEGGLTTGDISRFWLAHRVHFGQPNAGKTLREHVGYARHTKLGIEITPNGVRYVLAAMKEQAGR